LCRAPFRTGKIIASGEARQNDFVERQGLLLPAQRFWEVDDLFAMSGVGKRRISAPQVENCVRRLNEEIADSVRIHLEALMLDGFG
jgi:hypothetical protein